MAQRTEGQIRVMGIDPGLTRCGLSICEGGRGRSVVPVAAGVVRTPADAELSERLLRLTVGAEEWIERYQPDVVAIERIFERSNVSTVMHTAHAVGVLVLAAARKNIPVHMYTPSEVKKAISGNGRADKSQMTIMVTRILGLAEAPKPADAADALALAICHCWRAPMLAREKEIEARRAAQLAKLEAAHEKARQVESRRLHPGGSGRKTGGVTA